MKQTEIEFLTDPAWLPKRVETHAGHNKESIDMNNDEAFDNYQALQYGYRSYSDMITQINKKHQNMKLSFGDRYIQGWIV